MTETEGRPTRPAGMVRWLPLFLLLSLAFNLLLIGAFVGRWMAPHGGPPGPGPGPMAGHMIEEIGRDLSPADRAILEDSYHAHAKALDDSWESRHGLFDAVRQAMDAEPFDRTALQRAIDAVAQREAADRAAFAETLVDAASRMSPEGRRRLAERRPPGPGPDR